MKITDLNGKRVCILGFGREGQAMLRALEKYAPHAEITISDMNTIDRDALQTTNYKLQTGPTYLDHLDHFDVLIKSPGIPHQPQFDAVKEKMTSSTQIFFDTIADSGALVIGITGSKGKSTTSTLIYEILKAATPRAPLPGPLLKGEGARKRVFLIGNIGEPAIAHLADASPGTVFVLEMSSYQLMDLTMSPHIAVVTSFFPEHLDYHGSLAAYEEAKKHIARHQRKSDVIFFNAEYPEARAIAEESPGTKVPFHASDCPVPLVDTQLLGQHNRSNMAAATLVARHIGIDDATIMSVLKHFRGLPHRLQSLGVHDGVEWVDDAISTTPESTIAALDALGDRVATIILGGQDRGNDFTALGKRIAASSIAHVILFPGSGPRIRSAIEAANADVTFHEAASMEDAVMIAKKITFSILHSPFSIPIILLSTASPSYGMFKNFEEKGDQFRQNVENELNT